MNPETPEVKVDTNTLQEKTPIETPQENIPAVEQESEKDINWKKFKEARQKDREHAEAMTKKAAEKEAEALAMKQALEAVLNKPVQQQNADTGYYAEDETEDQRIEKKVHKALEIERQRIREENTRKEMENLPLTLKNLHRDFDNVCTTENLDYLEYHYPEVAKAYQYMPDNVEKWDAVYKAVKRFVPNTSSSKDAAKVAQNLSKPQMSPSTPTNPGSNPIPPVRLTEERRAANWERMRRTMGQIS